MGQTTRIEWCDSTVNPTAGCDGCELWTNRVRACYAGRLHTRFAGKNAGFPGSFNKPRPMPGRMAKAAAWPDLRGTKRPDKPHLDGLPRIIFIGDMVDVLSGAISDEYIDDEIIATIESEAGRRHFWVMLTKGPKRLAALVARRTVNGRRLPANFMAMTSVTTPETVLRVEDLLKIACRWRGVSVEPLLGEIKFVVQGRNLIDEWSCGCGLVFNGCSAGVIPEGVRREQFSMERFMAGEYDHRKMLACCPECGGLEQERSVHWVIVGSESSGRSCGRLSADGKASEDDWLGWASRLVVDCRAAGVPIFVKQIPRDGRVLHALHDFPMGLRFREMPDLSMVCPT